MVTVNNKVLNLNGYGIRKKWFVKFYIAALYTAEKANNFLQISENNQEKAIRLYVLHSKVEKKIR